MNEQELIEKLLNTPTWRHHSGRLYRVLAITNRNTLNPDTYPVAVVYMNTGNGSLWSRPISEWERSFIPVS